MWALNVDAWERIGGSSQKEWSVDCGAHGSVGGGGTYEGCCDCGVGSSCDCGDLGEIGGETCSQEERFRAPAQRRWRVLSIEKKY